MSISFRQQFFVAVSRKLGGKLQLVYDALSSNEQKIYPTASMDKKCIELEFQTVRNYYADLRQLLCALKLKTNKARGEKIQYIIEVEKEQKLQSIGDREEDTAVNKVDDDLSVLLVSHMHNIFQSNFPNFEVYINKQQI